MLPCVRVCFQSKAAGSAPMAMATLIMLATGQTETFLSLCSHLVLLLQSHPSSPQSCSPALLSDLLPSFLCFSSLLLITSSFFQSSYVITTSQETMALILIQWFERNLKSTEKENYIFFLLLFFSNHPVQLSITLFHPYRL